MTKLSREDERTIYRRIDMARRFAASCYHKQCDRSLALYEGEQWGEKLRKKADVVVVNRLKAHVDDKVAAHNFRLAELTVKPLAAQFRPFSEKAKALLSYDWRRGRVQETGGLCLLDYWIYGLAIGTTSWLFETEALDGDIETHTEGARPDVPGEAPDTTANPPAYLAPALAVREDRVKVARIPPKRFFVSPEAGCDLDDALFCGYAEEREIEEVRRDPRFKNTRQIKGDVGNLKDLLPSDLADTKPDDLPGDVKRITLYHYFEKRRRLHVVCCSEHDRPLLVEAWPHPFSGYPFAIMRVPGDPDKFFPKPTLLDMEHPQQEINLARTLLAAHMRQSNRKYQAPGALTEAQKKQLRASHILGIVEGIEPGREIKEIPHAPIQPEVFASESTAKDDLQVLFGNNAYEAFASPTKRMNQQEVAQVAAQGGARGEKQRSDYEAFLAAIASQMLAWLQQYSVATRNVPLFDRDGNVAGFEDVSREAIQGDYMVEVYVNSTTPPNTQADAQNAGLILQSLPTAVQGVMLAGQIGLDLKTALVDILKAVPGIRDIKEAAAPGSQLPAPGLGPGQEQAGLPPAGGMPALPAMAGPEFGEDSLQGLAPEDLMALLSQNGSFSG